jgi:hypothetical protein
MCSDSKAVFDGVKQAFWVVFELAKIGCISIYFWPNPQNAES